MSRLRHALGNNVIMITFAPSQPILRLYGCMYICMCTLRSHRAKYFGRNERYNLGVVTIILQEIISLLINLRRFVRPTRACYEETKLTLQVRYIMRNMNITFT